MRTFRCRTYVPLFVRNAVFFCKNPSPPYKEFCIKKRNGTLRVIQSPNYDLKQLQLKVLDFLEKNNNSFKTCIHGFVRGRSIVTNAQEHCSRQPHHLLNIDLKDFFPSITFYRVRGIFQKKPFECSYSVATVLAHICTYNNKLPQGAPTSPILANLVCRKLDGELMNLARQQSATYTRYADDITFSFRVSDTARLPKNICTYEDKELLLGQELIGAIERNNFRVNPEKSRLSNRYHRLEVTGITINEFPNVKRTFIDRIRGALHAWKVHGYDDAQNKWKQLITEGRASPHEKNVWKRQCRSDYMPQLVNVLWGKLLYVRMVRGKDNAIYTKLAEQYNDLCERDLIPAKKTLCSLLPIDPIVRNNQSALQATFVVEWLGDYQREGSEESEVFCSQATAFLYQSNNCLVTCEHIFRLEDGVDYANVPNAKLIARNPTIGGNEWELKVVHRDVDRDLAILEFVGPPPTSRYFVGLDEPIERNQEGYLIGFPNWHFGKPTDIVKASVRNRYTQGSLERLEISTTIRKGNSGGPYVNKSFLIAGIAQEGATQKDGNDACLCVVALNKWLMECKAVTAKPI